LVIDGTTIGLCTTSWSPSKPGSPSIANAFRANLVKNCRSWLIVRSLSSRQQAPRCKTLPPVADPGPMSCRLANLVYRWMVGMEIKRTLKGGRRRPTRWQETYRWLLRYPWHHRSLSAVPASRRFPKPLFGSRTDEFLESGSDFGSALTTPGP